MLNMYVFLLAAPSTMSLLVWNVRSSDSQKTLDTRVLEIPNVQKLAFDLSNHNHVEDA